MSPSPGPDSFSFEAQSDDGNRINGTIDAPDADAVLERLHALRLRVVDVRRVTDGHGANGDGNGSTRGSEAATATSAAAVSAPAPSKGRALRGEDFAAFNQQLAQLTKAGLPVEHGLRLIAGDMRRGRLSRTIEQVAEELERGTPLGDAFDKHRARFPTLYGRLIDAGVRAGNLPGVLLGLGRHLELVQRLRGTLWRSVSYPLMVFVGLCLVLVFLGLYVLPQFHQIYLGLYETRRQGAAMRMVTGGVPAPPPSPNLPWATRWLMVLAGSAPYVLGALVAAFVGGPLLWGLLRLRGLDRAALDNVVLPLPLVGPVLRLNLIARWCDALRLGVSAGLDLPAALEMAGDITGSPALKKDGAAMAARLEAGQPLSAFSPRDRAAPRPRLVPATVPAAIDLASGHHDLPRTLETLADMYERQAETRLAALPAIITPLLVILVAGVTAFVIAALLMPMVKALQYFI